MSARTLKLICAISMLLNIFLVAAAIGGASWLQIRRQGGGGGSIRAAVASLPAEQRLAFRGALREARQEMRPALAVEWQARRRAAGLLVAPKVDQRALEATFAEIRAQDLAVRAHVEGRIAGLIATLPAGARAELAGSLLRRPPAAPRR